MGLFKKQMLKVISWEDYAQNVIVHKFEVGDRYAVMKGSELIVRPSQAAVFVYRGSIADVFTEGNWTLEEGSTPVLTKLANWKFAFENPKEVDIYYISLKRFTQQKWGTPNPIMMRDKDFGMIRLQGHGEFSFHVMNPSLFMRECAGAIRSFRTEDIQDHLKSIVIANVADMLGECEIPALDLAANYIELGNAVRMRASSQFKALGLEIDEVIFRNLTLPPEVEKAMDKRTTLGVFDGKMADYAQYESVQAMRDAAKNPGMGGAFAGAGVGFGVGAKVGNEFAKGMDGASKIKCPNCGAAVAKDAKFCPECGKGITSALCPSCGKPVSVGAKFCPNCGKAMAVVCPSCGKEVKGDLKFCPECGAKLK